MADGAPELEDQWADGQLLSLTPMPFSKILELLGRKKPVRKRTLEFEQMSALFSERLQRWRQVEFPPATGARVGVLFTPWLGSAVPFFNLECALQLARRGCRVTVFRDFSNVFDNTPHTAVNQSLDRLLAALPPAVKVEDAERYPVAAEAADPALAGKLVGENAIWKMRGEGGAEAYLAAHPEMREQTRQHLGRIHSLFSADRPDWLLIPGGVWALSGMYLALARQHKIDVTTYDSDPNLLLLAHGGAATHHADLPASFARLNSELGAMPDREEALVRTAHEELARRTAGKDDFGFQTVAAAGEPVANAGSVFVPLNLRWDSAALARGRLFPTVADWVRSLVRWAEDRPDVRLCFRQHPAERFPIARGNDDVSDLWRDSPARGRIKYVAASDTISSYDLLTTARVVLPYTSTLGIEATMLGLPVIMATDCYYAQLGFVWNAGSVAEYFRHIEEALTGQLSVTAGARRQAALAYVVGQQWGQLRTSLTPAPSDFFQWGAMAPEELWNLPEAQDICEAMLTRLPLSYLRYRRTLGEAAK